MKNKGFFSSKTASPGGGKGKVEQSLIQTENNLYNLKEKQFIKKKNSSVQRMRNRLNK